MQTAVFASDVHITAPDTERCRLFTSFLESLRADGGITHVYLLGDIFDLWVADHDFFIERYSAVIEQIRRLRQEGIEVAYFEGNHDLYLRHFWERELGVTVFSGPTVVDLGNRRVRLEHGDEMDPDDTGYLFLRWFLRTPPIHFLCRSLPGSLIARIGERASAGSRHYTSNTKTIESDEAIAKIRRHAEKMHAEAPFDLIISGHVHIRDDWVSGAEGSSFRSINLGSWLDAPCYFKLDDHEARFVELNEPPASRTSAAAVPATESLR